jgi:nitrate/nitrite transport system permease protein
MTDVIIPPAPADEMAMPSPSEVAFAPPPVLAGPTRLRRLGAALLWCVVGLAGFAALWQLGAMRSDSVPTPSDTASELWRLWSRAFGDDPLLGKGIALQLLVSLARVGKGFALAVVVGVPLGLAIGTSRRAWQAINPLVQLLRPVSPLAWFPIWLALTKDGPKASIVVIFITALWPTVINTAAGVATIPHEQQDVARVFRFGKVAYLRHVLVPNALPSAITGMRLSMGMAWMVIVAVEMLAGSTGIGFFVWDSYNAGNLAAVASAIVVIGIVGLVLDNAFLRLSRHFTLEIKR